MSKAVTDKTDQYFQQLSKNLTNLDHYEPKGKMLAGLVTQKIQKDIIDNQVALPNSQERNILIVPKKTNEVQKKHSQQQLLNNVQTEKQALLQKIKELNKQEEELKQKIRCRQPKVKKIQPSKLQAVDLKFNQILKMSKQLKKSIQRKKKEQKEQQIQKSTQYANQIEKLKSLRLQQKRKSAQKHLKELKQRQIQRKQLNEASKKKIQQIHNLSYKYKIYAERDEEKKQEDRKQYQRKLRDLKESLKVDFNEIKNHQKKYSQHLQESQMKLQKKNNEKKHHFSTKNFGQNYFSIIAKAKMEQQKLNQYNKINEAYAFKQRICKFQQKIINEFRPKISNKSKFTPLKQTKSVHALSSAEQRGKGIQYLQVSKKLKDVQKQKQRRLTQEAPKFKHEYKDYTKELKYKTHDSAQAKFSEMVRHKKSLSNYQNLSKALDLANQIQRNPKMIKDQQLLTSAKNKIQILAALQNQ